MAYRRLSRCDRVGHKEPIVESHVETLTREVLQLHREAYYTLHRSQADKVAAERAQEESATRLVVVEADLSTENADREAKRVAQEVEKAAWETEKTTLRAQLDEAQRERSQFLQESIMKEVEHGLIAKMMQSALEIQLQAEADLETWTRQVHELRAQLKGNTSGTHPPP